MRAPLIRQLSLRNFLSYGPKGLSVDLLPLNVLIGPNASGKSNLLEALAILRAAAGDLQAVIREGGGIAEFLWKSHRNSRLAVLGAVLTDPEPLLSDIIRYRLTLVQSGSKLEVGEEVISPASSDTKQEIAFLPVYAFVEGEAILRPTGVVDERDESVGPTRIDVNLSQSILSQRRDPERYPELTFVADQFKRLALFQEPSLGRRSAARLPQPTDLPSDFLLPDASNLGLVLHDLWQTSAKRAELIEFLRRFYEPARYISTKIQGGTLQLYIEEEGGHLIPATRLSDGTLRYLSLLAILCHPAPPPVIAIEEPELGLHPDIIPTIAELLRKASKRTQLFVTTHSDALVSALSDTPESILVCEATPDGTTMKRLEAEPLREWLEKYSLGEIWRMGEIGGNRW